MGSCRHTHAPPLASHSARTSAQTIGTSVPLGGLHNGRSRTCARPVVRRRIAIVAINTIIGNTWIYVAGTARWEAVERREQRSEYLCASSSRSAKIPQCSVSRPVSTSSCGRCCRQAELSFLVVRVNPICTLSLAATSGRPRSADSPAGDSRLRSGESGRGILDSSVFGPLGDGTSSALLSTADASRAGGWLDDKRRPHSAAASANSPRPRRSVVRSRGRLVCRRNSVVAWNSTISNSLNSRERKHRRTNCRTR
jgi:hypothetical protein